MNAGWIYPFIILGGALQSCGAAMNAQLFQSLGNKWLANAVSFASSTTTISVGVPIWTSPSKNMGFIGPLYM